MVLRHAVRGIVLDEADRMLLVRHRTRGPAVWAAPGGGVEPGETPGQALARELREEVGLAIGSDPPHVWHQEVVAPGFISGYDGIVNDYYLVRTASFTPRGALTDAQLAAESIGGWRWWALPDIAGYRGPDLFSPRDLAGPLALLLADGVPVPPLLLRL